LSLIEVIQWDFSP